MGRKHAGCQAKTWIANGDDMAFIPLGLIVFPLIATVSAQPKLQWWKRPPQQLTDQEETGSDTGGTGCV